MKIEMEGEDCYEKSSMESSSSSFDSKSLSPHRPSSLSELVSMSSSSENSPVSETSKRDNIIGQKNRSGRKSNSYVFRVKEHVKMGPKLSETVKGKLSVGARIIKEGGRGNMFRNIFGISEGEKLLKASQCYLSTTAGPIAGILFISTLKIAFFSERSITLPSSENGESLKTPYKVLIPITKIKEANESENVNRPAQKYIQIVTDDSYEFWFMGFVRYEKAFMNLQKAISMSMFKKSM